MQVANYAVMNNVHRHYYVNAVPEKSKRKKKMLPPPEGEKWEK